MKRIGLILIMVLILVGTAGCFGTGRTDNANVPDINPKAEAAGKDTSDVTLYFSYRGEKMLAGETRTIDVPVSETMEVAVVRALINGPSPDRDELQGLFWQGVTLVDIDTRADYIFVTLSEEFISTEPDNQYQPDSMSAAEQKKLAIYAIVNTLTEMGKYSRVQIQVDRDGGVAPQSVTLAEAGFREDNDALEPLWHKSSMILTPENTLSEALDSFYKKDWTRLYAFTSHMSPDGTERPVIEDFSEALAAKGNVLETFQVIEATVAHDGQSAVVMLNYAIRRREGDVIEKTYMPVVMVREEDIWKLTYTSLVDVLINV